MNDNLPVVLAEPRWSHDRVIFEIEEHGASVSCSVSKAAIQDVSANHTNLPRDLLIQFLRLQDRITAAAHVKFLRRPPSAGCVLHIWSDDLDEDPQLTIPAATLTPET
ncbi:DUF1488 family protein [Muricoccus radiodurans]|uniref:DUF1488 family protein n=1 Tax=Muricoccus radiodurans TaxID=2231721 RepID=UPI003CF452A7